MDLQKLLEDVKSMVDANGDGKLSTDDLSNLGEKYPQFSNQIAKVQEVADKNGDDKVDLGDVTATLSDIPGSIQDALKNIGGMFGK